MVISLFFLIYLRYLFPIVGHCGVRPTMLYYGFHNFRNSNLGLPAR